MGLKLPSTLGPHPQLSKPLAQFEEFKNYSVDAVRAIQNRHENENQYPFLKPIRGFLNRDIQNIIHIREEARQGKINLTQARAKVDKILKNWGVPLPLEGASKNRPVIPAQLVGAGAQGRSLPLFLGKSSDLPAIRQPSDYLPRLQYALARAAEWAGPEMGTQWRALASPEGAAMLLALQLLSLTPAGPAIQAALLAVGGMQFAQGLAKLIELVIRGSDVADLNQAGRIFARGLSGAVINVALGGLMALTGKTVTGLKNASQNVKAIQTVYNKMANPQNGQDVENLLGFLKNGGEGYQMLPTPLKIAVREGLLASRKLATPPQKERLIQALKKIDELDTGVKGNRTDPKTSTTITIKPVKANPGTIVPTKKSTKVPTLIALSTLSHQALAQALLDKAEWLFQLPPAQLTPKMIQAFSKALGGASPEAQALLDTLNLRQPLLNSVAKSFDFNKNALLTADPDLLKAARGYAIRMLAAGTPPGKIAATLNELFTGDNPAWQKLPKAVRGTRAGEIIAATLNNLFSGDNPAWQKLPKAVRGTRAGKRKTLRKNRLTGVIAAYNKKGVLGWINQARNISGTEPLSQSLPKPTWTQNQERAIRDQRPITTRPYGSWVYLPPPNNEYKAHHFKPENRLVYTPQYDKIFGKGKDRVVIPINHLELSPVQAVKTWLESRGYTFDSSLWKAGKARALDPSKASRPVRLQKLLKDAPEDIQKAYQLSQQWNKKIVIASRNKNDILTVSTKTPQLTSCLTIDPANMGKMSHHLPAHVNGAGTIVLYVVNSDDPTILRPDARKIQLTAVQSQNSNASKALLSPENGKFYGDPAIRLPLDQAARWVQNRFNPNPDPGTYNSPTGGLYPSVPKNTKAVKNQHGKSFLMHGSD